MYKEPKGGGHEYRIEYYKGLQQMIEERRKECNEKRIVFGNTIRENREAARKQYMDMLGWPLNTARREVKVVSEKTVFEDAVSEIRRVQYEIMPGVPFYCILFRHKQEEPLPIVIAQHGGGGTPEMCSSFYEASWYRDMTMRVFQRGVNVLAPQMLLWDEPLMDDHCGDITDDIRRALDNDLKQLGGSIAALEIYELLCCMDYLEKQTYCNGKFAMTGLSYGGFYTLYTAAADTRIRAALASGHFNDRMRYNWSDKVWYHAGETFLDAQVGALVCPRYLRIEVGAKDQIFDVATAQTEFEILRNYYEENPGNLKLHVFDDDHVFCPEDEGIDEMLAQLR